MAIYVRDKRDICMERAAAAAGIRYDSTIEKFAEEFRRTKKSKAYSDKTLEIKRKKKYTHKMFEFFMENYIDGDDKFTTIEDKKKYGKNIRSATDILLSALKDI